MVDLEYEVDIPRSAGDPVHTEAEWRAGDTAIHAKSIDDHYECFWYTDAEAHKFVTTLEERASEHPDDITNLLQFTRSVNKGEEVIPEDQASAELLANSSGTTYIECELGPMTAYWRVESPIRNDLPDFPHLVHVSGPYTSLESLRVIYHALAPDGLTADHRDELIEEAINFIQQ
ncbi:hypothetical protein [Haloarcula argentinensis]|uniref:Uncharacterized protein n=1 Tax=Haloarcula argentinensis TaxID=43776 RepID=A0ABU2F5T7_HALAR|nr:hypothetical protein [Haloarcula argentinensis]EMA25161.1 hypothetical protein C443_03159 [Haloarcula argentinensis DSM 12282]MDS0255933.1 hypothetical protein [Haloarcula argentinensis]